MMTDDHSIWDELPPLPGPKRRSKRKDLEASVQRECMEWLHSHPAIAYVERRNTGAAKFSDGGFIRFGSKGAADIWCLIRGYAQDVMNVPIIVHIEIEVKRRDGKGRLSPDQKKFQAQCKEIGVPYFVVTSAEDLKQQLKEADIL